MQARRDKAAVDALERDAAALAGLCPSLLFHILMSHVTHMNESNCI